MMDKAVLDNSRKDDYGTGRIRFLALLPEIEKAAGEGHSLSCFYRKNKNRAGLSYSRFAYYWQQHRQSRAKQNKDAGSDGNPAKTLHASASRPSGSAIPVSDQSLPRPKTATFAGSDEDERYRDFKFDPMDAYRRSWD